MSRFPFPIPAGWFQVGYSADLRPGEVQPLHVWGRDLVLWRDDDGAAVLQQAHCPHLGAHLGYGGTVVGASIRCPFHGWRFDEAGGCVDVPYTSRTNGGAALRTYPLREIAGLVLAWHHPADTAPSWCPQDFADVIDFDCATVDRATRTIASAVQELVENTVDPAHFMFVHGTDRIGALTSYSTSGTSSTMCSTQDFVTPRGTVRGSLDVRQFGPGLQVTTISGFADATLVATLTPVDEDHVTVRFHTSVDSESEGLRTALAHELTHQLEQDQPIWEHKVYRPIPALVIGDGPIMTFRRWFAQFYV